MNSELKAAWAKHCGILPDDARAQEPDNYGWPDEFRLFKSGWDAAQECKAEAVKLSQWMQIDFEHVICILQASPFPDDIGIAAQIRALLSKGVS